MNEDPNKRYGEGNDIDQIMEKIHSANLFYNDTVMKNFLEYLFI